MLQFSSQELDSYMQELAMANPLVELEETLPRFISRQLQQLNLRIVQTQTVLHLAAYLDNNGYLRICITRGSTTSNLP